MALSDSEKRRVIDMLDRMSDYEKNRVLSSESSFRNWLWNAASWLFEKIASWELSHLLDALWNWFWS